MNVVIGIGALILIATITPGPNNLVVLQLAGARGLKSAVPAIVGIVAGGLALMVFTQIGLGAVASRHRWLNHVLVAAGVLYLGGLGARLMYRSFRRLDAPTEFVTVASLGAPALFILQFANPKAWVLVLTICAAARGAASPAFVLPLLFVAIAGVSLVAWAVLGEAAARVLQSPLARNRFDRVMGALLIVSAGSLAVGSASAAA